MATRGATWPKHKVTTIHDEILPWAKARGGRPAAGRSTHSRNDPGILRIEFPNAPNANDHDLVEISWGEFFEKFDEAGLALLYDDKTSTGERSNFSKLVSRETAEARLHGKKSPQPARKTLDQMR